MPNQQPAVGPQPQKPRASQRDQRLRIALVVLVLGQLLAFWMVCSQQVRKAQMRDLSLQVQRVAVADCLQYVPHATLNSCANRVDPYRRDAISPAGDKAAQGAESSAMSGAAPVNTAYR